MRTKTRNKIIAAVLTLAILAANRIEVKASSYVPYIEPVLMRVTVYTADEGALTADESKPREGIVASNRANLGYGCIIYENDNGKIGDVIGFFEVKDTGSAEWLKNGTAIDVYRDNLERCAEWVETYGDYCFIQIIPAEG